MMATPATAITATAIMANVQVGSRANAVGCGVCVGVTVGKVVGGIVTVGYAVGAGVGMALKSGILETKVAFALLRA